MEETVPFMNGGLFECLDKPHPTAKGPKGGEVIIYNDGFSDREDNNLVVPDFLFFDEDEEVDLSKDYGNAKAKKSKTRGLIAILKSYKFTITENTPIDEEVALDPELLGKVFENLLASYNPETKTSARKQTGSFYTPREIVNYMVEESLIAYLKNELLQEVAGIVEIGKTQIAMFGNEVKASQLSLEQKIDESPFKGKEEELDVKLRLLVSYNDINPFAEMAETNKKIIKALDNCKILDPACGSGAYPMGVLQKIVHILHKIDPKNIEWKQRQIDRVNRAIDELEFLDDVDAKDKSIKELKSQIIDIEASFSNNELDYGRKLYLIENCVYGVDIQPIAAQISKLRFFISLVVDQKVDTNKENFGIRPLPNLETKFVAANTLIGLEKPKNNQASLFDRKEVQKLENDLKKVRHSLFSIKTPSIKRKLREQDKDLREQISELLVEDYGNDTARLLANWDPYDQNTSSSFFDKEWMFDITDGFDIVIGNPPYIGAIAQSIEQREKLNNSKDYTTLTQKWDIYIAFIERGIRISKKGITCMIVPYPIINQTYAKKLREFILNENDLFEISNLSGNKIFEEATVTNCILFVKSGSTSNQNIRLSKLNDNEVSVVDTILKTNLVKDEKTSVWNLSNSKPLSFKGDKFNILSDYVFISVGMVLNADEKKAKGLFIKDELLSTVENKINCKRYIEAKHIEKYKIKKTLFLEWGTERVPSLIRRPTFPELYERPKLLVSKIGKIKATLDESNIYCDQTIRVMVIWNDLKSVKNKSIDNSVKRFQTNSRIALEKNSTQVNLKYLLALINSKLANYLLDQIRGIGNIDINPEYLKNIAIPKASLEQQQIFVNLIDQILNLKQLSLSTLELEEEIDNMVYKLYELTFEEVLIIEPNFSRSKEDYEGLKLE
jgi:hypothetical protein